VKKKTAATVRTNLDAALIILQVSKISASIQSTSALLPQDAPGLSMCDNYMDSVWWHNPIKTKATPFSKSVVIKGVIQMGGRVRPSHASAVTY
jgi:hypothetical protein